MKYNLATLPSYTEIFTYSGWKSIYSLAENEVVATIEPNSMNVSFEEITGYYTKRNSQQLFRIKNARTFDLTSTFDHNLLMTKLGLGNGVKKHIPPTCKAPDYNETGRMILAENKKPIYNVLASTSKAMWLSLKFLEHETIVYNDLLYGISVPAKNCLIRQNGKTCWTGTS